MIVVGIDPGLGCTGYAVLEGEMGSTAPRLIEAGAIRSIATDALPLRLLQIRTEILSVLQEFSPDAMGLEDLYTEYRFPRTALLMAHARGAICLAAAERGVPVWGFAARQVKAAITGYGAADKSQVQQTVARLLGLAKPPTPHDVADAMAIALTAFRRGGP